MGFTRELNLHIFWIFLILRGKKRQVLDYQDHKTFQQKKIKKKLKIKK